ncbi:hypothetical protein L1987_16313 [Smallanthus sonchifolius]|uniref:Uncharacterized protein n=1 Tax=Smallanthus sonchifolius TaxID=185202 RepID=A0ACB9JA44_9ASTR|nr:hypothetical protein L1987_16313 [Smallanthus sonchifolius]
MFMAFSNVEATLAPPIAKTVWRTLADVLNRIDGVLAYLVGENREYFRRGDFGSIRGVAQCVQDSSLSDCQDCLSEASGRLRSECETSTWGDMYLGKCYIRYADQGNENLANDANTTSNNEKSDKEKWIPIIGAILVGGVLIIIGLAFACRNFRRMNVFKSNGELRNTKKDLDETKGDVKDVKKDLEKTKGEVKDVKKDLAGTKEEVKLIKKDVECGKEQIKAICTKHCKPPPPPPPPGPSCPYMTHYPYCPYLPPSNPCLYLLPSNPNTCYYL